jgi:hypothetical protein
MRNACNEDSANLTDREAVPNNHIYRLVDVFSRYLPLRLKFLQDLFGRHIEIDFGRRKVIVTEDSLEGARGTAFVNPKNRESMAKHVGREWFGDTGFVANPLHHPLDRPRRPRKSIVQHKKAFKEGFQPARHRNNPNFGFFSIRSAFSVDPDCALLPLDLLFVEAGKLGHAESGFEQSINTELFLNGFSDCEETISVFDRERFPFVLVGHNLGVALQQGKRHPVVIL